jgi:hypothetical protein
MESTCNLQNSSSPSYTPETGILCGLGILLFLGLLGGRLLLLL